MFVCYSTRLEEKKYGPDLQCSPVSKTRLIKGNVISMLVDIPLSANASAYITLSYANIATVFVSLVVSVCRTHDLPAFYLSLNVHLISNTLKNKHTLEFFSMLLTLSESK